MSAQKFRDTTLAAMQQAVLTELLPDLSSSKNHESALATGRLLARLRVDLEIAPALAAERLGVWQQLTKRLGTVSGATTGQAPDNSDPLVRLRTESAQVAATVAGKRLRPEYLLALAQPQSAEASWFADTVAATRNYIEAYESTIPKVTGKGEAPAADPELMRQKLSHYLTTRFPALPPNPVKSFKVIPGGRSKETALFELVRNEVLPTRLVLRRDHVTGTTGTSVFGEYALLQAMEALGLPVPKPIAGEPDPAHLGGGFIIVEEVVDATRAGDLFPELNDMTRFDVSFAPDLARALARLHRLTEYPEGAELGGHHAASEPLDMVRNFQGLWDGLTHKPPLSVATELGFAWLLSHPLPTGRPRRLVHGDVGFHNMMLRDGKLAALLDWELTHIGDPAEDIGYIRAPILKPLMPWDRFVETYVAEGGEGTACDLQAVNWYSVWACTRNSVYCSILYDMACQGVRTDLDAVFPAIDFVARTQQYIVRELEIALKTP